MPNQILRRRGTAAAHASFTGGSGEITYITDTKALAIHDSSTVGGFPCHKFAAAHTTLTANAIIFASTTTTLSNDANLTWSGSALAIGGTSAATTVDILGVNKVLGTDEHGVLRIRSSDSFAINKGGSVSFAGKYNTAADYATFASIWGLKESSGDGAFTGYLAFATSPGETPAERWRITSAGILQSNGAQTIQTSSGILTVTGTGGLTLSTASNTNILLSPNGTGQIGIGGSPSEFIHAQLNNATRVRFKLENLNAAGSSQLEMLTATAGSSWVMYVPGSSTNLRFNCSGGDVVTFLVDGKVGIGTTVPSTLLHVGLAGTTLGTIGIAGNTSGLVTLSVAAAAGTWTMKLPTGVAGTAGFQLTDAAGDGVTSWASAASTKTAKNIINQFQNTKDALNKMLSASVYIFKYKEGMGTGDLETEYVGIMAEESPWAMHFNNKILNPVSTFGYTVLSIQALHDKISKLEETISKLTAQKV